MTRSIIKLLSQALLLLGPMLTIGWSFLDFIGVSPDASGFVSLNMFGIPLSGTKEEVEMTLRIIVTLGGFAFLVGSEVVDIVLPRRDLAEFRTAYFAEKREEWRGDPENKIPDDVRISIMHVRRTWYTLWITGKFCWTWNDGFDPPNHYGANMTLFTFQGVAGAAYRAANRAAYRDAENKRRVGAVADYRNKLPPSVQFSDYKTSIPLAALILVSFVLAGVLLPSSLGKVILLIAIASGITLMIRVLKSNELNLWPWQLKKIGNLKYILSIPILKVSKGNSKRWSCVGVITFDTASDDGAAFLQAHEARLARYFIDKGKVIACLR
jgi:hypothetical protein